MTLIAVILTASALAQPQCTIRLARVAELGSLDDPVARSTRMNIAVSARGDFFLTANMQRPQIARYSASGAFLAIYDRVGRGPGELSAPIIYLDTRGDTLFAFDSNRLMTFDTQLRPALTRTLEIEPRASPLLLDDGRIIAPSPLRRQPGERNSGLVHVLNADGRISQSLEPDSARRWSADEVRLITRRSGGGFWLSPVNDNALRRYGTAGALEAEIRIRRTWLQPWSDDDPEYFEPYMRQPRPRVVDMTEFAPDRMLVLGRVADAQWKASDREPVVLPDENLDVLHDTIVDVINVSTGSAVATLRHPAYLRLVRGSQDLVFAAVETPEGDIKAVVHRVVLTCS